MMLDYIQLQAERLKAGLPLVGMFLYGLFMLAAVYFFIWPGFAAISGDAPQMIRVGVNIAILFGGMIGLICVLFPLSTVLMWKVDKR